MAVNRAVSSHRLVNQRPLPVLGAAHNTRSSRHSTKSSGMWTSRPRFTLFPITSNLVYSEWERLRQPHGHRRSHRPGDPPHHYPRVRRPQLPHRCGPAAGSGTEGESQSPVNRHPPTPYSSGCPRSIQERGSPSALRRDSSARRRAPSLIASSQGESFEALNAHLERRCLARMDARLRGHSESIGQRMERDLERGPCCPCRRRPMTPVRSRRAVSVPCRW